MTLNLTNVSIIKRLLVGRNSQPLQSILGKLADVDLAALIGMLNQREIRFLMEIFTGQSPSPNPTMLVNKYLTDDIIL